MSELTVAAEDIWRAKTAADVLGPDDEGRRQRARRLLLFLHPDKWSGNDRLTANTAFAALQQLLAEEAKAAAPSFDVTTKTRTYMVKDLAFKGAVSNLYNCTYSRGSELKTGLLKLPRSVRDNDLVTTEAKHLKLIWDSKRQRRDMFPRFEESFKHRDKATGKDRRGLVIRRLPGFVSLAEVKAAFPEGLDARDLAWIWRRSLIALSLVNELGLVHGAIAPEHILIHPILHGVILCGFSSSVESGDTIKVLGAAVPFYPLEVFAKSPVTVATDVYMLHATMLELLRHDQPAQFRTFARACMAERPGVRPKEPRELLGHLNDLLERLYGERKFRDFPELPNWSG